MQCSVLGACDARLLATADLAAAATMAANGNLSSGSFSAGAAAMVAGSLLTSAAEDVATAATAPDAAAALPPTVVVSELELKQQQKDAAAAGGPSQQLYGARRLLPDTAAPTIRLLGEGQLYDTDTGAYGMIHTVFVGEAFLDPGAVAVDLVGTYPGEPAQEVALDPSFIAVTITAPSGAPASAVRTDVPTGSAAAAAGSGVPYVLSYDVADAAGNRARTVYRRVHVTCRPPEVVCFGSGGAARSCSVAGVCGVGAAADLSLAPAALAVSAPSAAAAASQAAASTAAPTLTLLGSSSVRVRAGLPYNRCQGLDTEGCELGANATATAPGDLAGQVVACADRAAAAGVTAPRPFVLVGLRYCGLDTRVPGRHTISFHLPLPLGTALAASANGSAATTAELVVRRIVVVEQMCDASEKPCGDGRCSTGGVCADVLAGFSAAATASAVASSEAASGSVIGASSAGLLMALEGQLAYTATSGSTAAAASAYVSPLGGANAPPQLQLRAYPPAVLEGQAVAVRRGTAYRRCTAGKVPTTQLPCEPGATAWDPEDGNITQLVALCPPADCAPSQCRAHAVAAKQPADCGVDTTTAPVGATLRLRLAVFDSAGAVAAAERVIRVVSPCGEEADAAAARYVCDAPPSGVTITGSTGGGYVCSEVPCEALAALYSGPAAGAASSTAAPRLFLLPALHQLVTPANSSAPGVLAASGPVALGRGAEANQTLALTYGAPSPVDLAPCASASALTSAASAAPPTGGAQQLGQPQSRPCAAVANSTLEGDLSAFIEVHVEPVCENSSGSSDDSSGEAAGSVASPAAACGNSCSVAQLSSGVCLPGTYRVVYSVEVAAGAAGAAAAGEATAAATALQLLVAVEEVRVTRLEELVFVPWAEQLQQQQQPAGAAVAAAAATNRTAVESLAAAMRLLLGSGGGSSTAAGGELRTVTAAMSAALAMLGMAPAAVRGVELSGSVALLELGPAQQQQLNLTANATTLYALRVSSVSITTAAAAFRPTPAQLLLPPADRGAAGRHRRRLAQQAAASAASLAACGIPAPSLPSRKSSTAAANTSVTATAAATSGGVIVSLGGLSSACTTPPINWVDYLAAQLAGAVEDVDRAAAQAAAAAEAAAALAAAQAAAFEGRDAAYEALVGQWAREAAAAQAAAEARAAEALRVLVATLAAQDTVTAAAAAVQSLLQVALTEATESTRLAVLTADAVWGGISPQTDDTTLTDAANSNATSSDSTELDAFLTCARLRGAGNGASFSFTVTARETPPALNTIASTPDTATELNTVNGSHHRRRLTSAAASDEVFQGYVLAAAAREFDYSLWDVRAVERARHVGSSKNRVLAGLLLHQVRRTAQEVRDRSSSDGALCRRSTHTSLVPSCVAPAVAAANATAGAIASVASSSASISSGDLGGIGIDPHFERRSGMFRPDINASDYYNTSQRSPELNPAGTPYGFFHLPLPGARHLAPGYPVLLDVRLSAQRAAQALDYLARGAYLSAALTKSLDATLVFYSADAAVFGVWSVSFTWLDSGVIQATARLLGLPAISYGQALSRLDVTAYQRRLLPDLALLLLIACYCLLAGWDAYHTLSAQARLRRERVQREELQRQQEEEDDEEGKQREVKLAAGWAAAGGSSGGSVHGKPGTGNGGASAFALAAAQMLARADDGEPGSSELVLEPPPPPPPQQQLMVSFTGNGPRAVAEAVEDAAEGARVWGRDHGSVHTTALPEQRDTRRILYGGRPAVDIHENNGGGRRHRHGRWGIRRSSAAAAAPKAKAKGGSGGADGPAERGAHYRPHMSVLWLCYEAAVCGLMAAALGVFFTYAIRLSVKDEFTAGGDVYDADTFSPARFFLIKRREPQASALANGTTAAAAPAPGDAGRWRLLADASAWEALGAEFGRVDDMYGAVVLYSFLQALVSAMLLVRLLHALSFQPRLSVISGTLARAMPGLAHLFLVATVVVVMLAAAVMVTSGGSRAAQLSSWSAAVTWMYKLVLLGDDEGVFTALLLSATALPAGDRVVTGLVYGLSCFAFQILLGCFVLVLLLAPFYELKLAAAGQPGVPQDLARILRWWLQHNLRRAPKNKALACRIDDWLLQPPPAGGGHYRAWARLLQPLAVLRLGKGGGKGGWGGGGAAGEVPVKAKAVVASGGSGGGYFRPDTPGGSYFTDLAGIKVSTTGVAGANGTQPGLQLGAPSPLLLQLPSPLFPGSAASTAAGAAALSSAETAASPVPPVKRSRTGTATTLRLMNSSGGGNGGGPNAGGGGGGGAALDLSDVSFALRTMSLKQIVTASASGGGSSAMSPFLTTTTAAAAMATAALGSPGGGGGGGLSRRGSRLSRGQPPDFGRTSSGLLLLASRRSMRSGRSQRNLVAGAGVVGHAAGGETAGGEAALAAAGGAALAAAALSRSFSSRVAGGVAAVGGSGRRGTATDTGLHGDVNSGSSKTLIAQIFSGASRRGGMLSAAGASASGGASGTAAAAGGGASGRVQQLVLPQLPPTLLEDTMSEEEEAAAAAAAAGSSAVTNASVSSPRAGAARSMQQLRHNPQASELAAAPFPGRSASPSFTAAASEAEGDDIFSTSKWRSEPEPPPAFGGGEAPGPGAAAAPAALHSADYTVAGLPRPETGPQSASGMPPAPAPLLTSPAGGSPLNLSPAGSSSRRSLVPRPAHPQPPSPMHGAAAEAAAAASLAGARRLPRRTSSLSQQHQFSIQQAQQQQQQQQQQLPSNTSLRRNTLSRMGRESDAVGPAAPAVAAADRRRATDTDEAGPSPPKQSSPVLLRSPEEVAAAATAAAAAAEAAALADTVLHNLMLRFGGGGGGGKGGAAPPYPAASAGSAAGSAAAAAQASPKSLPSAAPSPAVRRQPASAEAQLGMPLPAMPGQDTEEALGSSGGGTPHGQGPASAGLSGSRAFQPWTDAGFVRVSNAGSASSTGMVSPAAAAGTAAVAAAAAAAAASPPVPLSPRQPLRSRLVSLRRSSAVTAQELATAAGQQLGLAPASAAGLGANRGVLYSSAGAVGAAGGALAGMDGTLAAQPQPSHTVILRSSAAGVGIGGGGAHLMTVGSEQTQEQAAKAVPGIDIEAPAAGAAWGAASPGATGQAALAEHGQHLRAKSLRRLPSRVASGPIILQQSYKALRNIVALASPTAASMMAPAAMPAGDSDGGGSADGPRSGGARLRLVLPRATADGDGAAAASPRGPLIRVVSQSSFGAPGRTRTADGAAPGAAAPAPTPTAATPPQPAVGGVGPEAAAATAAGGMNAAAMALGRKPLPKRSDSVPSLLSRVAPAAQERPAPPQAWLPSPTNHPSAAAAAASAGIAAGSESGGIGGAVRQPHGAGWRAHVPAAATASAAPAADTAATVALGRLPVNRSSSSTAGTSQPMRPATAGAAAFVGDMSPPAPAPVVPLARFASSTGVMARQASLTSAAPVAAAPASPSAISSAHLAALVAQHEQRQRHQEQPRLRPAGTSTFEGLAFEEGDEVDAGVEMVGAGGAQQQHPQQHRHHRERPAAAGRSGGGSGAGGGLLQRRLPARVSSVPSFMHAPRGSDWRLYVNAAAAAEHAHGGGGFDSHGADNGVEEEHLHPAAVSALTGGDGGGSSGAAQAAGPSSVGGGPPVSRLTRFAHGAWVAETHSGSLGGAGNTTSGEYGAGSNGYSGLQSPMLLPPPSAAAATGGGAAASARTAVVSIPPATSTYAMLATAASPITSPRSGASLGVSGGGAPSRLVPAAVGAWSEAAAASAPEPAAASVAAHGSAARGALSAGPGPVAEALEVTSDEDADGEEDARVAPHQRFAVKPQSKQGREGAATAGDASRYAAHTRAVLGLVAALEVMVSELRDAEQQLQGWMAVLDRLHVWLLRDGAMSKGLDGMAAVRRAAAAAAGVASAAAPRSRGDASHASPRSSSAIPSTTDDAAGAVTAAASALGPSSSGGPFAKASAGPALVQSSPTAQSRLLQPPALTSPQVQPAAQAFSPVHRNRGVSARFHRLSHSSFALPTIPATAAGTSTPGLAPVALASGGVRSGSRGPATDGGGDSSADDGEGLLRQQPSPRAARAHGQDGPARTSLDWGATAGNKVGSSSNTLTGGGGGDSPLHSAPSPATAAQRAHKAARLRQRVYELTSPALQQQQQQQQQAGPT
ncbi:hypothetical protein HXX76_002828 [Chlamydomonas incerta]|uniref:Polycystin cation channel PKD1/PKD2 domain-containing protein n=1 Tax=Chlamydomonas incerta TaxID=51695 RepID=A0A835TPB0_CHLIN|nr:hypothetical protein HXX76_002828 [Chlamydomonas incerta]|eukprot:KAG2442746.1 hypothetical protein HXX76_002828 [Chlamydomonas incerta]